MKTKILFLLLISVMLRSHAAVVPLNLVVQEGTSSSGEAEYSTKKYQPLANLLAAYLKRDIQVTGLSPLRQFDAESIQHADLFIVRPNAVAGMAIQTLGYTAVVGLDPGMKSQTLLMGGAHLKKSFKSVDELKKLRFAMPPADSETTHDAQKILMHLGLKPDAITSYYVKLQATIPFALENKLADVGVVKSDSTVAAKMNTSGYVVLAEGEKTAPWVLLANKKLGDAQIDQIRIALMSMMSNPDHKLILQNIRVQNTVEVDDATYVNAYKRYISK